MRTLFAAAVLQGVAVGGVTPLPDLHPGHSYLFTRTVESSSSGSDNSSSSTHDVDQLVEHVLTVDQNGAELEWDLPRSATKDDRARTWQFPARIVKPANRPMELRNGTELERRLANWLRLGKMTRAACRHWIFTWNAFKIECDPQSVLHTIAAFDVIPDDLREGQGYAYGDAGQSALLKRQSGSSNLIAQWQVNPADVRRQRAESDVVVAEIMRKPLTMEAALKARAAETVSGTVTVTFEGMGSAVRQRRRVTTMVITRSDGKVDRRTETEVVEQRRLPTRTMVGT